MLHTTVPVNYLGCATKSGVSKAGKDYVIKEASLFVPDLGRVKVQVVGNPPLPPDGTSCILDLSIEQGSFQSMRVVWDEMSRFKAV